MVMKPQDKKLLEYIKGFMLENNYPPTMDDMVAGMGAKSKSTVYVHYMRLIGLGYIEQFGRTRYRVKGMKYVEVS